MDLSRSAIVDAASVHIVVTSPRPYHEQEPPARVPRKSMREQPADDRVARHREEREDVRDRVTADGLIGREQYRRGAGDEQRRRRARDGDLTGCPAPTSPLLRGPQASGPQDAAHRATSVRRGHQGYPCPRSRASVDAQPLRAT